MTKAVRKRGVVRDIRRDERGIAAPIIVIVLIVVIAIGFLAAYALGYLTPSDGAKCPPSVCGSGETKVWIRVDVTGTVVPNIGAPPSLQPGSLALTAALSSTPASLVRPPGGILDETSTVSGTLTVTYPGGSSFTYTLPQQSGVNQYNFDLFYFIEGPHGSYAMSAVVTLTQTGCWLGCAPGAQYTVTGHFNL